MSSTLISKGLSKIAVSSNGSASPSDYDYIKSLDYDELEKSYKIHKYYPQYIHNGGVSTPEIKDLIADKPIYAKANLHVESLKNGSKKKTINPAKIQTTDNTNEKLPAYSSLKQRKQEVKQLHKDQRQERKALRKTHRKERRAVRNGQPLTTNEGANNGIHEEYKEDNEGEDEYYKCDKDGESTDTFDDDEEDFLVLKNPFDTQTQYSLNKKKPNKGGESYNGVFACNGQFFGRRVSGQVEDKFRRSSCMNGTGKPSSSEYGHELWGRQRNSIGSNSTQNGGIVGHHASKASRIPTANTTYVTNINVHDNGNANINIGNDSLGSLNELDHQFDFGKVLKNNSLSSRLLNFVRKELTSPELKKDFGHQLHPSKSFDQTKSNMTNMRGKASKLMKLKLHDKHNRRLSDQIRTYIFLTNPMLHYCSLLTNF